MQKNSEHLGLLKTSSAVVKVFAWIFLVFGVVGGIAILLGLVPQQSRWMGLFAVAVYAFSFFFFYLIAKVADLLIDVVHEIKAEIEILKQIKRAD